MSFFDDLKKPVAKAEPQHKQFVITNVERLELVNRLCFAIKNACEKERRNGKRAYKSNYVCYLDEGRDREDWEHYRVVGWINSDKSALGMNSLTLHTRSKGNPLNCARWTQEERDKILELLRKKLVEDGFPADAVCANEYIYGGEGTGLILRNRKSMHTIQVDVRW